MEDDWDSDDGDKEMQLKEWKRLENGLEKTGYKEGMESAQDSTLQDGFNQAFRQAIAMGFGAGRLQGGICASMGRKNVTSDQDSNKTSDILGNLDRDVALILSEIPDTLCSPNTESCQTCSCSSSEPLGGTNATGDNVQDYWARLQKIQEKAEKEDKCLDSSFVSHD